MPKKIKLHYDVSVGEPKPNKMFDEWQHAITKYLTYTKPVKCACCGKMKKRHWTQLKFFQVADLTNSFSLEFGKTVYPPLTPVCCNHILKPELP